MFNPRDSHNRYWCQAMRFSNNARSKSARSKLGRQSGFAHRVLLAHALLRQLGVELCAAPPRLGQLRAELLLVVAQLRSAPLQV